MNGAPGTDNFFRGAIDIGFFSDVHLDWHHAQLLRGQPVGGGFEMGAAPRGNRHARAATGERVSDGFADTGAAAGDERNFVVNMWIVLEA